MKVVWIMSPNLNKVVMQGSGKNIQSSTDLYKVWYIDGFVVTDHFVVNFKIQDDGKKMAIHTSMCKFAIYDQQFQKPHT